MIKLQLLLETANFSPKVKEGVRYEIFYGVTRAVNTGKKTSQELIRFLQLAKLGCMV